MVKKTIAKPTKTIATKTIATKTIATKTIAKANKRTLIPSWDRVDNNLALVSKNMNHRRTKDHKRGIKAIRSRVASDFAKFDLANLDPHFTNVHNHLQSLNNQPSIMRAFYTADFKTSLMWLIAHLSILKGAAESAGLFDKPDKEKEELESDLEAAFAQGAPTIFNGFDFMIDLDELEGGSVTTEDTEGGSVTTEDTTLWSITTADTVPADLDDFFLDA